MCGVPHVLKKSVFFGEATNYATAIDETRHIKCFQRLLRDTDTSPTAHVWPAYEWDYREEYSGKGRLGTLVLDGPRSKPFVERVYELHGESLVRTVLDCDRDDPAGFSCAFKAG